MEAGYCPFVLLMPVTQEQRAMLACGETDTVCDQLWAAGTAIIEQKKAQSVQRYRCFMDQMGDANPHRKGIVLGVCDPEEFLFVFLLGLDTQTVAHQSHIMKLKKHGIVAAQNAIAVSMSDETAIELGGWLLRFQAGKIDFDTSFYDGERMKTSISEERCKYITSNGCDYALCVMELCGGTHEG